MNCITPISVATGVFILGVLLQANPLSAAQIRTCVQAESKTELKSDALVDLVSTEIAHFPSHLYSNTDCETVLYVETFPFAEKQFVTLRMGSEVPVRFAYENTNTLVQQIKKGLRLVLANDPVYLKENISQYSTSQRALHSLSIKGSSHVRLELFESVTRTGKGAFYAPGMAVGIVKGTHNLFVFSRLHGATALPAAQSAPIRIAVSMGLDAGFTYEFNRTKPAAGYLGTGMGLSFTRFEGRIAGRSETVNALLLQGFATAGIRLFRLTDFNMVLFVTGYLPCYPASDVDSALLGSKGRAYTPQVQTGVGITF
jgi:hypothetical protein